MMTPKEPKSMADFTVAFLELGYQAAQALLSIACEMQRLNDNLEKMQTETGYETLALRVRSVE